MLHADERRLTRQPEQYDGTGSLALTSAPRKAAGTTPTASRASMSHGTTPRHA